MEAETPASDGTHGLMVAGTVPRSRTLMEQLVPGSLSSDDSRGLMTEPTSRDQSTIHHYVPRRRLSYEPSSPPVQSSTFRPPDRRLHRTTSSGRSVRRIVCVCISLHVCWCQYPGGWQIHRQAWWWQHGHCLSFFHLCAASYLTVQVADLMLVPTAKSCTHNVKIRY